jgi:hypothetical protein
MKQFLLRAAWALLLIVPVFGQDGSTPEVLQNSDFSSGLTHWDGDCRSPSTGADGSAAGPGAMINLLSTWTQMTQDFNAKKGAYLVKVTFTLTPETTFSSEAGDYRKIPSKLGLTDLSEFRVKRGDWCLIVTDLEARRYVHCAVTPAQGGTLQTITGSIQIDQDADHDLFCLAFPPGHGSITIQSVSMTPQ